ncbi:MAG TPA: response regulator transcription factor [Clostridiaceae bacterium]
MEKTILIVEDEDRMRRLVADYFKREGYQILEAVDGIEALRIFHEKKVSLVILDIMMPRLDGFEVCKNIRKSSDIPIIIVTAKSEEDDKLMGFEFGADDYVTKPFSPKVLIAKSKALLKRAEGTAEYSSKISVEGLSIDELSHEVLVEGEEVSLSPKEYELLLFLIRNKGIVLSRDKLLDNVWGMDYFGDARTVDTSIKRLREKIKGKADLITTIRGSGYRFEVKK